MKKSTVFRRAARLIANRKRSACCFAIGTVASDCAMDRYLHVRNWFYEYFVPLKCGAFWWPDFSERSQSERVLALLFAAAIAESEGD